MYCVNILGPKSLFIIRARGGKREGGGGRGVGKREKEVEREGGEGKKEGERKQRQTQRDIVHPIK
jgi:hypothetical protein